MVDSSNSLLAVATKLRNATRNRAEDKTRLAARGWLKSMTIALPHATTSALDLRHADVWCNYSSNTGLLPKEKADIRLLPAKKLEWTIQKSTPGMNGSAVIEVPTTGFELFVFSSSDEPHDSLEFYKKRGDDLTLYVWRDYANVTLLTVLTPRESPLAAAADKYTCKVKICDTFNTCRPLPGTPVPPESGENPDRSWPWGLIGGVGVAVVAIGVMLFFAIRWYRRRASRNSEADPEVQANQSLSVSKGNDQSAARVEETEESRLVCEEVGICDLRDVDLVDASTTSPPTTEVDQALLDGGVQATSE